jgi:hypothetical protein
MSRARRSCCTHSALRRTPRPSPSIGAVIREGCAAEGGVEVDTLGDAFFFAFRTTPGALAAAAGLTESLTSGPVQARVGLHTVRLATQLLGVVQRLNDEMRRLDPGPRQRELKYFFAQPLIDALGARGTRASKRSARRCRKTRRLSLRDR